MCGIAGFIGFADQLVLARMANRVQRHRGPDHQEVWHDEYIALAHQRLSIIDLSEAANQPFHKGDYVIIFNGEIYNFQALRQRLSEAYGVSFSTTSDTEVILEMFIHYREKCLDQLIGMFAFAIYHKGTQELFIARDHFGIKPLFYTRIDNAFAFSSELKTLVQIPGFDKTLNPKALVSSLHYIWVSGHESMFNNCFKLPPAHYLSYRPGEPIRPVRYYEIREEVDKAGESRLTEELAALMEASVDRHMVADVPVSSFLSGGLDSSLISVLAKKSNPQLSTYTIGTQARDKQVESMPDDEKYAEKLARDFQMGYNLIRLQPDILRALPDMVRTLDEPIGDPAAINTYLICKAARERGVKVLLSGMGADELFFGYRRQKATLLARRFHRIPYPFRLLIGSMVRLLPVKIGQKGFKLGRWAKRFMSFANLPLAEAYKRSYSYYDRRQSQALLKPAYWPAIDEVYREHERVFTSKFIGDPINQICHTDIHMFMVGLNLSYTDRASMAASVEVRVPFIDREVVRKAMSIPGKYKMRHSQSKYILKKAAEKFLPHEIIYRPKASFGAPIRSWISNELRPMVDQLLSKENIERRGILEYTYVKKMIDEDRSGKEDYAYQIYQLLTLELWCRSYLDEKEEEVAFEALTKGEK